MDGCQWLVQEFDMYTVISHTINEEHYDHLQMAICAINATAIAMHDDMAMITNGNVHINCGNVKVKFE
jgi:hypothetical protein